MTSDEIRQTFLDFFASREHTPLPSAPLVPQTYDPSVLLTTAGMHPLKPFFLGLEPPPALRLTSCQKVFRATDIENVGNTARHLTFFEMLGNFSIGDYFKPGAVQFAWELSREGFGFAEADIWVTVHAGDDGLGLGPDEAAIEAWSEVGMPGERIVALPSSENFWQAGPTGPCGPCSELYLDRGSDFGDDTERPGDDGERFLEFWNLVFMQFNQEPVGKLTPLPSRSIDTGMGLNRMAAILQQAPSVYETDQFAPLMQLGGELSGRALDQDAETTRALRILADHARAMTFLVADGVVPSNEDRGYILRRVMRRAIQQGRVLDLEPGYLVRYGDRVIEVMGGAYPELSEQSGSIRKWLGSEEEGFGRTLEYGSRRLAELIDRARDAGQDAISAADAFALHDTFGFPIEITTELVAEQGLGVDRGGFDALMDDQRSRARASQSTGADGNGRDHVREFAGAAGFQTEFTGYERVEQQTTVGAVEGRDGNVLVKLVESPFYAAGGGQISDAGTVECEGGECRARVAEVFRVGDDQAVALEVEAGALSEGERVVARVDWRARHATECNHTATHLLHAALRERLGDHVRQAGSYVGPDKLRFDFTHGGSLSDEELRDVVDRVNDWVLADQPVRAITTTLDEARRLGAMALFGEKYGDVVRMVEVGDGAHSRELCGGTHVAATAEIGLFKVLSETSSAANVRRIEALTGPAAVTLLRERDLALEAAAATLRKRPEEVPAAVAKLRDELKQVRAEGASAAPAGIDTAAVVTQAVVVDGARVLAAAVPVTGEKELLAALDRAKAELGEAAIVLGAAAGDRVMFVASVAPALIDRGVRAGEIVKAAAQVAGGGGGGRDTMARAGGRDPEKLPEALQAARTAIEAALS